MATRKTVSKTPANPGRAKKASFVSQNVKSFVDAATYNQRVQEKAYELYLKRAGAPGDEVGDWLEAEKIIAAETK